MPPLNLEGMMLVKIKLAYECLNVMQRMIMADVSGEGSDKEVMKSLVDKLDKVVKELKKEVK